MSRTMEKVVPVKITTDQLNCYATIERSCISSIIACLRMKNVKGKHIETQLKKLHEIKKWAENSYNKCVKESMHEIMD